MGKNVWSLIATVFQNERLINVTPLLKAVTYTVNVVVDLSKMVQDRHH